MDILSVLFSQQRRRIGIIVPSVAISEKRMDATEITPWSSAHRQVTMRMIAQLR